MAFKASRSGIMFVFIAGLGILFAAMPLLGLGADVSPDADNHLERRYGNIGIGLALGWVALMVVIAMRGVLIQFRPPKARSARGQSREQVRRSRR
ncbi:MAG: hypothetical protein ABIR32_07985 [Ilumatobacteraceae bacterium]